jgi:RNA polymerase sigma-B factor
MRRTYPLKHRLQLILITRSIAPFLYAWAWSDRSGNRDILMGAYFSLVRKVAHNWVHKCQEEYEDLEQLATLGLLKAIDRFDFSLEFAFSSYAIPKMNGEIQHHLRDHACSIRIPRRFLKMRSEIKKTRAKLLQKGRSLSRFQTAIGLGYSVQDWNQLELIKGAIQPKNIDDVFELADKSNPTDDEYTLVRRAVRRLSKEHRDVIDKLFFNDESIDFKFCQDAIDKVKYFMELEHDIF